MIKAAESARLTTIGIISGKGFMCATVLTVPGFVVKLDIGG